MEKNKMTKSGKTLIFGIAAVLLAGIVLTAVLPDQAKRAITAFFRGGDFSQEVAITPDSFISIKFSTYGGFMPFEEARRDFTVSNDGLAVLNVKDRNGNITSTNSVNLGRIRVEQLARLFLNNQFFNLKDRYTTPRGIAIVDAGIGEIYLKLETQEKTVAIDPYVFDYLPKNLKTINDELLNLVAFARSPKSNQKDSPLFTFEIKNGGQCGPGQAENKSEFLPKDPGSAGIPFKGQIITPTPCDNIGMRSATKEVNNALTLDLVISDKPATGPCIECLGISRFAGRLLFWPKGVERARLMYKDDILDTISKTETEL